MILAGRELTPNYLSLNAREVVFMALTGKCIYQKQEVWRKVVQFNISGDLEKIDMFYGRVNEEVGICLSEGVWPIYEEIINFTRINNFNKTDQSQIDIINGIYDGIKMSTMFSVNQYINTIQLTDLNKYTINSGIFYQGGMKSGKILEN